MEIITFNSKSKHKVDLLIRVALEMGATAAEGNRVMDEGMTPKRIEEIERQLQECADQDQEGIVREERIEYHSIDKIEPEGKIDLLAQLAKEIGVKYERTRELTDEDVALPGAKFTQEEFEAWLAKEDGEEEYSMKEVRAYVKGNLAKMRKKKAA
jgi:hypothetical protein